MNFNTIFTMTHFLKLCYNVFILENKIDAPMFRKICVNLCYVTLDIVLICVNMERVSFWYTLVLLKAYFPQNIDINPCSQTGIHPLSIYWSILAGLSTKSCFNERLSSLTFFSNFSKDVSCKIKLVTLVFD
jgi:hypothetical protein